MRYAQELFFQLDIELWLSFMNFNNGEEQIKLVMTVESLTFSLVQVTCVISLSSFLNKISQLVRL